MDLNKNMLKVVFVCFQVAVFEYCALLFTFKTYRFIVVVVFSSFGGYWFSLFFMFGGRFVLGDVEYSVSATFCFVFVGGVVRYLSFEYCFVFFID